MGHIDTIIFDGIALASERRRALKAKIRSNFDSKKRAPYLAIIRVGEDPASRFYVSSKQESAREVGIASSEHFFSADTRISEVLYLIGKLNASDAVDGILVQLPLPEHIDTFKIACAICPNKDVDGVHPRNIGQLDYNEHGMVPCTAKGIIVALEGHGVEISGKEVVVVGRSNIVGRPVARLLQRRNATVTLCHSYTQDLATHCRRADIVVVASGSSKLVGRDWIKPGASIVDVGVSRVDGRIVGDVDFEGLLDIAGFITPSKGGIGPMTVAMLLENVFKAYSS